MKKNPQKSVFMILLIVLFCVFMAVIDGVFKADYFIKSTIKLVLFLVLPAVYSFYDKDIEIVSVLDECWRAKNIHLIHLGILGLS